MYSLQITYDNLVERLGEPLFKFEPKGGFSEDDYDLGDVPRECAVFKHKNIAGLVVYSRYGDYWGCNEGHRFVIKELMEKLKAFK